MYSINYYLYCFFYSRYCLHYLNYSRCLCAQLADTNAEVIEHYYSEETCYQSSYYCADALNTLHPFEVVEAHSVES